MDETRRKALVQTMPGFPMTEHFEALNRASQVFGGNSLELLRQVSTFVGTDAMAGNLGNDFEAELVRLLHNYLASVGSLRDAQRTIHRKVWTDRNDDKKSAWEVEVYNPKTAETFSSPDVSFIQNLRNYTLHYALPVPSSSTNISWSAGGPVQHRNELRLKKARLLKYKKWPSAAKTYINQYDSDWVEFLPAIESYSQAVRAFYQWFWDALTDELEPDWSDFKFSHMEYALEQSERLRWQEWKMSLSPAPSSYDDPPPAAAKRLLAEARRDRWAHGSRGWRIFQADENGQWAQTGEDPWGLPTPGRH